MPISWNIFAVQGASQHGASQGVREPCKIATGITDSAGPAGPCVTGHIENRAIAMLGIAPAFGATPGYMPLVYIIYLLYMCDIRRYRGVCAVSHRTYPSGLAAPAMPPHSNRFTGKGGKLRCIGVVLMCLCTLERGCCEVSPGDAPPTLVIHTHPGTFQGRCPSDHGIPHLQRGDAARTKKWGQGNRLPWPHPCLCFKPA